MKAIREVSEFARPVPVESSDNMSGSDNTEE
jgi:hypothetical protein